MPPIAAVSPELAIKVLKKYIAYFTNGLPRWSSEVWQKIQQDPELEGKWKIASVRTNITKNRNNILSKALEECGISVYTIPTNKSKPIKKSTDCDDSEYDDSSDDNKKESSDQDYEEFDTIEQDCFTVELTRDEWNKIKNPEPLLYKGRKYTGFKPKVWSNIVSYAFWKQHHLKCAFVFKRGRITKRGRNYATISGYCKAKNCRNPVKGIIKDSPGDVGSVYIKMYCYDTRFTKHDEVKRPLKGAEHLDEQEELLKMDASAWRKSKAEDAIEPGNTGSPIVINANTLYQVIKEAINNKIGIKANDSKDMILYIRGMDVEPSCVNSVLAVDTPVYELYAMPIQFQANKEHQS